MLGTRGHWDIGTEMGHWDRDETLDSVGVQCPISSSLGEFPSYWDWLLCPGLSPGLMSIPLPFAFYTWIFPFALPLPLDFNCVSSLRPTYRHPFGRPFTYSLFR